jgi:hypothetical protein
MENLQVPDINPGAHPERVKMAIMNAERSAALGVWLIVVPCYFLLCVFMYYRFHLNVGWFGSMFTLLASLEKMPFIDFLGPGVLFILPIVCIVINMLAIVHVHAQKQGADKSKVREFSFTVRIKPWNIVLIIISIVIILIFMSYVMTESISIKN